MKPVIRKTTAIIEVIFVAFVAVPYFALGISRLSPRLESWLETLGFQISVPFYLASVIVVLLLILARRKNLADYGINFHKLKYQLDITLTCFIPVALVSMLHAIWVDPNSWGTAPILAGVYFALLLVLARLLRKKPTAPVAGITGAVLILMPGLTYAVSSTTEKAIMLFLSYALFVGFGEEILYRGDMQSRLNEAFGRPFKFFGVPFGWGAVITNILFGLMHIGVQRWILGLNMEVTLAWGFWTVFSGLVFSFVREKSGGILAPALLHGLPQAIASVAMLFLK